LIGSPTSRWWKTGIQSGLNGYYSIPPTAISTRRLRRRPFSVVFGAVGLDLPNQSGTTRRGSILCIWVR